MARPKAILTLTEEDRTALERFVRRGKTAQQLALRARIVLASSEGLDNVKVAKQLRVCDETVAKWRRRFIESGVDGLLDAPRPGAPRSILDDDVERVVVATLESTPKGATHWSTRDMAKHAGISHSSVGRIWRAFGLQPHRSETFKLSNDPLFIEKLRDIVGLYMNPPEHAVVLCVDEKTQIQAVDRTQPLLPLRPGQVERRSHDYVRHGTTSLFAALDVKAGTVIGETFRRHRAEDFRCFLDTINDSVPADLDVHVVADNYSTHKAPVVCRWFAKHPRFHIHFTPTYSSWLNLVERWFGLLTEKQIKRGADRSTAALEKRIHEYLDVTNADPKPFHWTRNADEILQKLGRFCEGTLRVHGGLSDA